MRTTHVTETSVVGETELYLELYRSMVLIRGFEELIQSLFLRGEVYGTTHLYCGQEAVAVGMASVLEERDRLAATYRGHGHALALGVDPQRILDEMLGRATGINGGRAGSMNINSPANRLVGSFGIVGGTIGAATGVGLALKRVGGVAVCQFGDGAINQGYFYECLNFCQVMRLPVVFLCENNGYGEYTPFAGRHRRGDSRARRGDGGARRDGGRDERRRRACRRPSSRRACARRERTVLPRGAHLPLRRPFAQRSRRVQASRGARRVEGARPDPTPSRGARGGRRRAKGGRRDRFRGRVAAGRDSSVSALPRRSRSRPRTSEFKA